MNNFFGQLKDILFLDIETASLTPTFEELPERLKEEWIRKTRHLQEQDGKTTEELYFDKAGIHAEFGKVVCIGVGFFMMDTDDNKLVYRTKSFAEEEEHDTLWDFRELLEKKAWILCGHNGKEFDFPYLCRRMLINGIVLPEVLQISGKKPWEIRHLDTMEMWKFGDYKYYTRLELLAAVFDIPSSKEGIDGSMVNHTYYRENNLEDIRKYCLRDVEVTARLFLAYHGMPGNLEIEVINLDDQDGD